MAMHVLGAAATYVLGRHAARGFESAAALTLLRAIIASALLLSCTGWLVPRPRFSRRDWWQVFGLGILLVPLNQLCFLTGMQNTVPGHPAVIYAMTPIGVVALSSVMARAWPPRRKLLGVLAALAGVLIVLRPWVHGADFAEIRRGDFWLLAGLLIWVVYTVAVRPLARRHDSRTVTTWTVVAGTLVLAPFAALPLARTNLTELEPQVWAGVLWLAVVTSAAMMLLWNRMLRHLEPVEVAICTNAQPVATGLLVWMLAVLGLEAPASEQDLGVLFWVGTALVIAGVVLVQMRASSANAGGSKAPVIASREGRQ